MYPMTVEKISAVHRGGTKEYTLIRVANANGRGLLIMRYSKVRQAGQVQVERFDTEAELNRAHSSKQREKFERGGYETSLRNTEKVVNDQAELLKALGMMVSHRIGADNLRHLDANADVDMQRMPEGEPEFEEGENGKPRLKQAPPRLAELSEPTVAELNAQNPKWGMF
jgi:predicted DNA-binding WGR domain protein